MAEEISSEPLVEEPATPDMPGTAALQPEVPEVQKRGRGRPPGSKNRPKEPKQEVQKAPEPPKASKPKAVKIEVTPVVEPMEPEAKASKKPRSPPKPKAEVIEAPVSPPSPRQAVRTAASLLREMHRQEKARTESFYASEIAKFMR